MQNTKQYTLVYRELDSFPEIGSIVKINLSDLSSIKDLKVVRHMLWDSIKQNVRNSMFNVAAEVFDVHTSSDQTLYDVIIPGHGLHTIKSTKCSHVAPYLADYVGTSFNRLHVIDQTKYCIAEEFCTESNVVAFKLHYELDIEFFRELSKTSVLSEYVQIVHHVEDTKPRKKHNKQRKHTGISIEDLDPNETYEFTAEELITFITEICSVNTSIIEHFTVGHDKPFDEENMLDISNATNVAISSIDLSTIFHQLSKTHKSKNA